MQKTHFKKEQEKLKEELDELDFHKNLLKIHYSLPNSVTTKAQREFDILVNTRN